jgi:hypothetical protein
MSKAELLLSRLDGVRQTGVGRWIARCPAHDDRNPSLAIREVDDGILLLKCFGGCSVSEITTAVGLSLSDLFPDKPMDHRVKPERRPFLASDVFRCVSHEALVAASCAATLLGSGPFSEADRERLMTAASRLQSAAQLAGVMP